MSCLGRILVCLPCTVCGLSIADAQSVRIDNRIELTGRLAYPDQLSGVAFWRGLMIACPDEGADFNVLRSKASGYELVTKVNLLSGSDEEIDMEGAASDGTHVYIVGSHSMRRKKVDEEDAYKKNRKRLTRVTPHSASYSVFRIQLNADGELAAREQISLQYLLEENEILQPFTAIPGKENGVDVEGVAVKDGKLFVGFRGPVLRGNFVPVLSFAFDNPDDYDLKLLQLNGRGIRDIVSVEDGFLVLAGPIGDGDADYRLYLWDGEDCVPGTGESGGRVTLLGSVATIPESKPEGIAVMMETADEWRLLVLHDGDVDASEVLVSKP